MASMANHTGLGHILWYALAFKTHSNSQIRTNWHPQSDTHRVTQTLNILVMCKRTKHRSHRNFVWKAPLGTSSLSLMFNESLFRELRGTHDTETHAATRWKEKMTDTTTSKWHLAVGLSPAALRLVIKSIQVEQESTPQRPRAEIAGLFTLYWPSKQDSLLSMAAPRLALSVLVLLVAAVALSEGKTELIITRTWTQIHVVELHSHVALWLVFSEKMGSGSDMMKLDWLYIYSTADQYGTGCEGEGLNLCSF